MKLKSFDELSKLGFIYNVLPSGKICICNNRGSWKIIDFTWFEKDIEVAENIHISVEEFKEFKEFFMTEEVKLQNMDEVMPDKKRPKKIEEEAVLEDKERVKIND